MSVLVYAMREYSCIGVHRWKYYQYIRSQGELMYIYSEYVSCQQFAYGHFRGPSFHQIFMGLIQNVCHSDISGKFE